MPRAMDTMTRNIPPTAAFPSDLTRDLTHNLTRL